MLTLQELKQIVEVPVPGRKIPTAKKLKTLGTVIVKKRLGRDAEIVVYQNGYAVYWIGNHSTVFLVHSCREYLYESGNGICTIKGQLFDLEAWYVL